jgi:hypothetical protein
MASYRKSLENLDQLDKRTQSAVLLLYKQTEKLLKSLIVSDKIKLDKALTMLDKAFDEALVSTDFVASWQAGVTKVIVDSSYNKPYLKMEVKTYNDRLLRTSLWTDKTILSERLRKNSAEIVMAQKEVMKTALIEGRSIVDSARLISKDGFTKELPDFLEKLKKAKLGGEKIDPRAFRKARKQALKLKTGDLRRAYIDLIDAIDLNKNIDNAVEKALVEKTNFYAYRTAQTETLESVTLVKNGIAMDDPDTQYVRSITSGSNPCPYCVAVENVGFVPVENATIPTHHPHCFCTVDYKKTSKRPKAWSDDKHTKLVQKEIDKANEISVKAGRDKTYIKPEQPRNIRKETMLNKLAD